ncbi:MAG: hypothetical protein WBB95_22745 [Pseudomonas sp.]|uniref:hypothetical protein n=1 Tax=Pseudomonas sp. TaxID=306 RepID=UPI003C721591
MAKTMGCRLQANRIRGWLPPPGEGVGVWVHVIPIKTGCEVLFGYMLIIKIIDYAVMDYSVIAFGGALRATAKRLPAP